MTKMHLYNDFVNTSKHTSIKGDGGPELFYEMTQYVKQIKDPQHLQEIIDEIEIWLRIGAPSYYVMAVNLVSLLKLVQFKDLLQDQWHQISRGRIPDFNTIHLMFIENTLKELG